MEVLQDTQSVIAIKFLSVKTFIFHGSNQCLGKTIMHIKEDCMNYYRYHVYYKSNSTDTILEITPFKCKFSPPVIGVMVSPDNSTQARGIRAKVKVVRLSPKAASVGGSMGMLPVPRKFYILKCYLEANLGCNTVCMILATFQHQRQVMIYQGQIQGVQRVPWNPPLWKSVNSIHN